MTKIIGLDKTYFPNWNIKCGDWVVLEEKDTKDKNLCVIAQVAPMMINLICVEEEDANRYFESVEWMRRGPIPDTLIEQMRKYNVIKVNVEIKVMQ